MGSCTRITHICFHLSAPTCIFSTPSTYHTSLPKLNALTNLTTIDQQQLKQQLKHQLKHTVIDVQIFKATLTLSSVYKIVWISQLYCDICCSTYNYKCKVPTPTEKRRPSSLPSQHWLPPKPTPISSTNSSTKSIPTPNTYHPRPLPNYNSNCINISPSDLHKGAFLFIYHIYIHIS